VKVVAVTGASAGVGAELARRLSGPGLVDRMVLKALK